MFKSCSGIFLALIMALSACDSSNNTTGNNSNTETESPVIIDNGSVSTDVPPTSDTLASGNTTPANGTDNTTQPDPGRSSGTSQNDINIINVSFISIGEGIDSETYNSYKNFVDSWKTSAGKSLSYETIGWGREGETDLCFNMSNIGSADRQRFLTESRNRLQNNNLVQITTNQPCKEQRTRK